MSALSLQSLALLHHGKGACSERSRPEIVHSVRWRRKGDAQDVARIVNGEDSLVPEGRDVWLEGEAAWWSAGHAMSA